MTISDAKAKLTIAKLAEHYFPKWKPAKSCRRPWGKDINPSFSVYDGSKKWKDHATGEGGDAVDFLKRALGLSNSEACRKFIEIAENVSSETPKFRLQPEAPDTVEDSEDKQAKRVNWPKFDIPSNDELLALARLRSLPLEGPKSASDAGILRTTYYDNKNLRSWAIVSGCGRNAQVRRLDGMHFEHCGQQLKAKTLPGSIAQIPVGRFSETRWPLVVVVEGGPDVLAAYAAIFRLGLLFKVSVCGILGAGIRIPSCAMASMANRRVRILQHNDSAGYKAANEWAKQLHGCGAKVDIWTPSVEGADLNDVFKLSPDACEQELGEAFDFAKGGV